MVDVVVLGSLNADLSAAVQRIPAPGETVMASGLTRSPGGKGGNQAVAAARAGGASTAFVGAVGDDGDGVWLLDRLKADAVDTSGVATVPGPSGMALISVDAKAENAIVVVPGANAALRSLQPDQESLLRQAKITLAQLEVPLAFVAAGAAVVREEGGVFVLNAAPAQPLPDDLLSLVDVLVVNEHEARDVAARQDLEEALDVLAARVGVVVLTRGARGSTVLVSGGERERIDVDAVLVEALDTTAAGDTYCGVLVAGRAAGLTWPDAARRAAAAAAITVTRRGAQDSIPTRDEWEQHA